MIGVRIPAQFHPDVESASEFPPRPGRDCELRVREVIERDYWTVEVARMGEDPDPPASTNRVPNDGVLRLEGGTLCAVIAKVWDAGSLRVILLIEVIGRVRDYSPPRPPEAERAVRRMERGKP